MKEFKAWNPENRQMLYNVAVQDGKHVTPEQTLGSDYWDAVLVPNNNIVIQFTGFLDKNGKKIFENDILKIYYQNNQKSYLKEVKWLNDSNKGLNDLSNKGRWDALDDALDNYAYTSCEVVGNIFENPELLAEINNN
jgi:uncharacterized phage protein (TIGR01671 family)